MSQNREDKASIYAHYTHEDMAWDIKGYKLVASEFHHIIGPCGSDTSLLQMDRLHLFIYARDTYASNMYTMGKEALMTYGNCFDSTLFCSDLKNMMDFKLKLESLCHLNSIQLSKVQDVVKPLRNNHAFVTLNHCYLKSIQNTVAISSHFGLLCRRIVKPKVECMNFIIHFGPICTRPFAKHYKYQTIQIYNLLLFFICK